MILSAHQPQPFPWMGYFNKVLNSDIFVWLNTVQYRPRHDHNRAKIRRDERAIWLTLPAHATRDTNIKDVTLADPKWRDRTIKTIEHSYKRTPYFRECWPPLHDAIGRAAESLDSVNYETFTATLDLLDAAHVSVVRADRLPVTTDDATDRLVEICKHLGASHYLSGRGGRNYMRVEAFDAAGLGVVWQDYDFNRVEYAQAGGGFIPGLSIVDCIFNVGPAEATRLAKETWTPQVVAREAVV